MSVSAKVLIRVGVGNIIMCTYYCVPKEQDSFFFFCKFPSYFMLGPSSDLLLNLLLIGLLNYPNLRM